MDTDSVVAYEIASYERAWAAGLFEGEGCLTHNGGADQLPKLVLVMSDEDSVWRFRAALNIGRVRMRPPSKPGYKHQYEWRLNGQACQVALAVLWPGLGARRRARARELWPTWVKEEAMTRREL